MKYSNISVIPMPKEVIGECADGSFEELFFEPSVYTECAAFATVEQSFVELTEKIHGVRLAREAGGIELILDSTLASDEYRIDICEEYARAYASNAEGAGYAMITLVQLLKIKGGKMRLPKAQIKDRPECEFRGVMVDLARQWHKFESLLFYVDLCALYKIKYLHLHFMDTQSYTLPSAKFPKMSTAGRHYSFDEIKKLNEYAAVRGIELIPEIEFPGHSKSMVTAYPELFGNTPDGERVEDTYSLFNNTETDNIICIGKPGVMDNIRVILKEIIDMFPNSEYIHIGGDEATIADWNNCRDCKKYMAENGISGVKALYSHSIKLITDEVLALGRTPIVWEGFPMEGADQISRDVVVIAWESFYLLPNEILDLGFKVINASWQPLYIIPKYRAYDTLIWGPKDILAWNIYNWQNWNRKTAAYLNPINVQPTEQVMGGLFCVWECKFEEEVIRVVENLAALSERTWTVRRYATDKQFMDKLDKVSSLAYNLLP